MSKALRVLITGAAGGIGMATAQVLANRGHSVVATDISALSGTEGIQAHVLDVTSDDSVARCLKEVGPLDAIVNNAAIFGGGHRTNLSGTFHPRLALADRGRGVGRGLVAQRAFNPTRTRRFAQSDS